MSESVAVVGGGITGLAAALELTRRDVAVTVFESADRVGGRIRSTPFAGVEAVDEGADAFLARVPEAVEMADGLQLDLTHPEAVGAAVWHHGLHDIPEGLMLGVPGKIGPLARTKLLSWPGKMRAALEPLLPRTSTDADSIGAFVRARFGDEVHERLVDALVGSIYATDTDRFSLAEVPQLDALARRHRSLLVGARQMRASPGTGSAAAGAIFAAPRAGVGNLATSAAAQIRAAGGDIRLGAPVVDVQTSGPRWSIDGDDFDAAIFATPAQASARLLRHVAPDAVQLLEQAETADVILVSFHIAADEWPDRLRGRSGYLVPKPVQNWVTAASFGSQKWAHWKPPSGGEILRVSLGRDGRPVLHLSDDDIVEHVLSDLHVHLGVQFSPLEVRISRWPGAFAQYRPHHGAWVDQVEAAMPSGIFVTGASYRGIGVPACVRQGSAIGERAAIFAGGLSR